ncbi:HpcH/HpaI aldolase family protein [Kocuria sp.]|uniref:HpcH/HpaI aldolase family protein n=1 Tax=Kocuria sp. TaxID=1871328 RepID=UPI0026E02284|nr:HpcH/HpaI aldolase/citrate lyase family protein [Kocuria sp.]MDO5619787.1 HpcH/HpaI aldolase/citrate lyase family protein [Kocuria sp.]
MPIRLELPPTFADQLTDATRPLVGSWVCSGSPMAAEITAGSGVDWILFDGEHSPIELETMSSLLRAAAPYPATAVVRVPSLDTVFIKQVLDLGAQNIMVPMVDTPEQAQQAAAAMFYPPRGVRGIGSALARSARWNGVPDYLHRAHELVSLTVQIESVTAVDNAAEIAAVEGVDAVFVGPADLAASMGLIGQQTHPEVTDAVLRVFTAVKAAGKRVGVNAFDPAQAKKYAEAGADFVAVTSDVTVLAQGTRALADQWIG